MTKIDLRSRPLTRELWDEATAKRQSMESEPPSPIFVSPQQYRDMLPWHKRVVLDIGLLKRRLWFRIRYGSMKPWLDRNTHSLAGLVEEPSCGSSPLFASVRSSDSDGKLAAESGRCCNRCERPLDKYVRGTLCWVCTDSVL